MAITFDNIAGGELAEKFKIALAHIGRNILDPNMDPKEARGITIDLKFKPDPSGAIRVSYGIKTKLASFARTDTTFLIGQDVRTGRIEMSEYNNNQPAIQPVAAQPSGQHDGDGQSHMGMGGGADAGLQGAGRPIDLRATI